jgi:hypothetical protein
MVKMQVMKIAKIHYSFLMFRNYTPISPKIHGEIFL